jgi:catechol 2,3-dioxygenase-like lactoylglutathione lyase family enzyme
VSTEHPDADQDEFYPVRAALSHLALSVGSLEASREFYRAAFGFDVSSSDYYGKGRLLSRLMEVPDCDLHGLFMRLGTFFLELLEYAPSGRDRGATSRDDDIGIAHLSFVVEDLRRTGDAVDAAGGETRWETQVDLSFGEGESVALVFCTDPDGNRIEVVQHRDEIGRGRHAAFLGAGELGWPTPEQRFDSPG